MLLQRNRMAPWNKTCEAKTPPSFFEGETNKEADKEEAQENELWQSPRYSQDKGLQFFLLISSYHNEFQLSDSRVVHLSISPG